MTTSKKLWLGFGVLTALLVVTVSVIFLDVRALRGQVAEMATSREIGVTSRKVEINVLGYALDVRRYLQTGEPDVGAGVERAAAKVDGSIAEYQRLATTAPRREMAGRLV